MLPAFYNIFSNDSADLSLDDNDELVVEELTETLKEWNKAMREIFSRGQATVDEVCHSFTPLHRFLAIEKVSITTAERKQRPQFLRSYAASKSRQGQDLLFGWRVEKKSGSQK